MHWKKTLWIFLITVLAVSIFVILFLYYANYSEGFRAGVVMKVSRKGYIFKTYEGELNVEGITSDGGKRMPSSVWEFSVEADRQDILKQLEEAALKGYRVKLVYHEKFVKLFWRGDTPYFVVKVEVLEGN
ncbi:MAG: hypothetical protein NZM38_00130 [Cytophagales bacterium]|nr:hypothetical protein [Cytophagales bacterium]MDW8383155.1 hypothetical protein [Flammeovirgaceae bacterium]